MTKLTTYKDFISMTTAFDAEFTARGASQDLSKQNAQTYITNTLSGQLRILTNVIGASESWSGFHDLYEAVQDSDDEYEDLLSEIKRGTVQPPKLEKVCKLVHTINYNSINNTFSLTNKKLGTTNEFSIEIFFDIETVLIDITTNNKGLRIKRLTDESNRLLEQEENLQIKRLKIDRQLIGLNMTL